MSFLPFGDRWAAQSPRVCNVGGGAGCGVVTFSLEWSGVPVQVQRRFQVAFPGSHLHVYKTRGSDQTSKSLDENVITKPSPLHALSSFLCFLVKFVR